MSTNPAILPQQIPGPYLSFWNPDFLSETLRRKGTVARYYPKERVAVDIGRPRSLLSQKKKALLMLRGIQYFCFPKGRTGQFLTELLSRQSQNTVTSKKLRFPRL